MAISLVRLFWERYGFKSAGATAALSALIRISFDPISSIDLITFTSQGMLHIPKHLSTIVIFSAITQRVLYALLPKNRVLFRKHKPPVTFIKFTVEVLYVRGNRWIPYYFAICGEKKSMKFAVLSRPEQSMTVTVNRSKSYVFSLLYANIITKENSYNKVNYICIRTICTREFRKNWQTF